MQMNTTNIHPITYSKFDNESDSLISNLFSFRKNRVMHPKIKQTSLNIANLFIIECLYGFVSTRYQQTYNILFLYCYALTNRLIDKAATSWEHAEW